MAWAPASGRFGWGLLVLKVFLLVVWPLAVMLPVAITQSHSDAAVAACIFFALLPHVVYPWAWLGGKFLHIFELDDFVSYTELLVIGVFSGLVLPVMVLTPMLEELELAWRPQNVLLACTLMLVGLWVPLLVATFWAPALVNHRQNKEDVSTERSDDARKELLFTFLGLVFMLSVPLCFLLPIYLRAPDVSERGETALMFFMLFSHCASFFVLIAPRIGIWLHVSMSFAPLAVTAEIAAKLIYGMVITPVVILLPMYFTLNLAPQPKDMMLAFIIALPSIAILDCLRLRYSQERAKLQRLLLMWFFGVILPLGVLLATWLASDPSPEGATVVACFMFGPPALVLIGILILTLRMDANLPFEPLTFICVGPWWWNGLYIVVAVCVPLAILLPVYFFGKLAPLPRTTVVAFAGILSGLLAVIFAASVFRRSGGLRAPANSGHSVNPLVDLGEMHKGSSTDEELGMISVKDLMGGGGGGGGDRDRDSHRHPTRPVHRPASHTPGGDDSRPSSQILADQSYFVAARASARAKEVEDATLRSFPNFPGGSLRSNGSSNLASRLAASLQSLGSHNLLPARTDGGAPNTWELASLWTLDADSGEMVCTNNQCSFKVYEPDTAYAIGKRFAVFLAHVQGERTDYVLKWHTKNEAIHTRDGMTRVLQAAQLAHTCADEFNKCLAHVDADAPSVRFLPVTAICLETRLDPSSQPVWAFLEPDHSQDGAPITYLDGAGHPADLGDLELGDNQDVSEEQFTMHCDLAQALACFSYHSSQKSYVMTNLRGKQTLLCLPEIHWAGNKNPFGDKLNRGDIGVQSFVKKHKHNRFCSRMLPLLEPETSTDADNAARATVYRASAEDARETVYRDDGEEELDDDDDDDDDNEARDDSRTGYLTVADH